LEELRIDGRTVLELMLMKRSWGVWTGMGTKAGSCERCHERPGFMKGGQFIDLKENYFIGFVAVI
jgi:hypothetical protein